MISLFKRDFNEASKGKNPVDVFDDFLTVTMAVFTKKPNTGLLYYAEEFEKIAKEYKERGTFETLMKLPYHFFFYERAGFEGIDLLGEFYMQEIASRSSYRYFIPYQLCVGMTEEFSSEATHPACILDTAVESGRLLLAFAKNAPKVKHRYYGIEIDPLCAKMAALNMFIHDMPGEVILADNFEPDNFKTGYRINLCPAGIFSVPEKEKSQLWHMYKNVFSKKKVDGSLSQSRLLFF
ncbi:MAG: N-6 DNA methylase [Bacteroidetes bacterium]|nr:N-6 DNA methylase [Bacteroidota bacterium]